jgi:hypothetical protein
MARDSKDFSLKWSNGSSSSALVVGDAGTVRFLRWPFYALNPNALSTSSMVNAEVLQRDGVRSFQVKRDVSMCVPTIDLSPMERKNPLK